MTTHELATLQLATMLGELVATAGAIDEDYLADRLSGSIPRPVFTRLVDHQVAAGRVVRHGGWLHWVRTA